MPDGDELTYIGANQTTDRPTVKRLGRTTKITWVLQVIQEI